jgi:hypothetical protein
MRIRPDLPDEMFGSKMTWPGRAGAGSSAVHGHPAGANALPAEIRPSHTLALAAAALQGTERLCLTTSLRPRLSERSLLGKSDFSHII